MKTLHVFLWSLQQELRPVHVKNLNEVKQLQHSVANAFFTQLPVLST